MGHAPPAASRRPVAPNTYAFGRASPLSWEGTADRLGRARAYWLATTNPVGTPHVTPVWGVWLDGYLWFDGLPTTRWARNLSRSPCAAVHLESAEHVVIADGVVADLTTDDVTGGRIREAWRAKYGSGLVPDPVGDGLFRFRPRKVKAWSEDLADGVCFEWARTDPDDSASALGRASAP